MLELLNNMGGIIVAVIASFTAFKLYNHKQQQTKKYETYESLFESINKLNRHALRTRETCKDIMNGGNKGNTSMSNPSGDMSQATNELVMKRHLVYLNTSPAFINEFKRFEKQIERIASDNEKEIYSIQINGYDPDDYVTMIHRKADILYKETENLITRTRTTIDHDLKRK